MIAGLALLQLILPLVLVAWLAFVPVTSAVGLALRIAGTGAFLFALARVAQWAVVGWWLPWVHGALWTAAALAACLRTASGPAPALLPSGVWGWAGAGVALVLLGLGSAYGGLALAGRIPPPAEVVDIGNPLGAGHYLVGHGGSNVVVNGHVRTLDETVESFRPWRGQSYALDFFGLGALGVRARGWRPADPEAYAIYGAPVRAPCPGAVVAAEGGRPDFPVPLHDPVNRLGNHVILRCGSAEIVFAHLRRGSLGVKPGDRVSMGDLLGQVGNSGASTEPHLHLHAQGPAPPGAPPISGAPLALRVDGRFLVRNDRLRGAPRTGASTAAPATAQHARHRLREGVTARVASPRPARTDAAASTGQSAGRIENRKR